MTRSRAGINLTRSIVEHLGSVIVAGKYDDEVGFPTEAELCTTYDASRSAVREAVKMLTARGLLSARPRQGTRVEPEENWAIFDDDVIRWFLSSRSSPEVFREITEVRIANESTAAAMAALRQDPDAIEDLRAALERMEEAANGQDDPVEADIAFHTALCRASGNRFFARFGYYDAILIEHSAPRNVRWTGSQVRDLENHRAIFDAIVAGDPEKARCAQTHHRDGAARIAAQSQGSMTDVYRVGTTPSPELGNTLVIS